MKAEQAKATSFGYFETALMSDKMKVGYLRVDKAHPDIYANVMSALELQSKMREVDMDLPELVLKLKEDIEVLEKINQELKLSCHNLEYVPNMVYGNLKIVELMCSEQVKAQKGEESTQIKFDSVEKFAEYLGLMTRLTLKYLEDKYEVY